MVHRFALVAALLAPLGLDMGPAEARRPRPAPAADGATRKVPSAADTVDDYLVSPSGQDANATGAKILFRDATTAFDLGDWKRAFGALEEAYRRQPDPALLFDLAQVKNQLGDCEGTIFYFRRYLQKAPEGPHALVARARLEVIEATHAGRPRGLGPNLGPCFTPRRPAQLRIDEDSLLEPNSLRQLEPVAGAGPEGEAVREARGRYKQGVEHYDRSRFREAALEMEAAYRDFPEPEMLFDVAQAWRKAGEGDRAVTNYRSFLRRVPQSPLRAFVEERLREMSGQKTTASPGQKPAVAPAK